MDNDAQLAIMQQKELLQEMARSLNTSLFEVPSRVNHLLTEREKLQQELEQLQANAGTFSAEALLEQAQIIGDVNVITADLSGGKPKPDATID